MTSQELRDSVEVFMTCYEINKEKFFEFPSLVLENVLS